MFSSHWQFWKNKLSNHYKYLKWFGSNCAKNESCHLGIKISFMLGVAQLIIKNNCWLHLAYSRSFLHPEKQWENSNMLKVDSCCRARPRDAGQYNARSFLLRFGVIMCRPEQKPGTLFTWNDVCIGSATVDDFFTRYPVADDWCCIIA